MRRLLQILFIVYCAEAGVFLLLAPWGSTWERLVRPRATSAVTAFLGEPAVRGAVSGFGLVHLVWGAHDLLSWVGRRRSRDSLRT